MAFIFWGKELNMWAPALFSRTGRGFAPFEDTPKSTWRQQQGEQKAEPQAQCRNLASENSAFKSRRSQTPNKNTAEAVGSPVSSRGPKQSPLPDGGSSPRRSGQRLAAVTQRAKPFWGITPPIVFPKIFSSQMMWKHNLTRRTVSRRMRCAGSTAPLS